MIFGSDHACLLYTSLVLCHQCGILAAHHAAHGEDGNHRRQQAGRAHAPVKQDVYKRQVYNYSKALCEKNAASEGVASRCVFRHGDANHLNFPDESFDAVVSNYVYHNINRADKRALLMETLRVLKKGGVFALNDEMKPRMYGDMEEFAQELRDMGYQDVRLIDTAEEAFGSRRRAAMMMLGSSRLLVGRK